MTYEEFVKLMPGIAAIIAIIGTIIAAYLTFRLNSSKNERSDRAKRIEETYVLFNKWLNLTSSGIMPWAMVKPDGISYDQAHDIFNESAKKAPDDLYSRLRFSILIMLPELMKLLNEVEEINDVILKKIGKAKKMFKETGDYDHFREIGWMDYASKMDKLKKKIDDEFINVAKLRKLT